MLGKMSKFGQILISKIKICPNYTRWKHWIIHTDILPHYRTLWDIHFGTAEKGVQWIYWRHQTEKLRLKENTYSKVWEHLKFVESSNNISSQTSEYVLSSSDELIADYVNVVGERIQLSVALRNIARSISLAIQQRSKKTPKTLASSTSGYYRQEQRKGEHLSL